MSEKEIYSLKFALQLALIHAEFVADTEDGGTSNMDMPTIQLPGWSRKDIHKAFENTRLKPNIEGKTVFILGACKGQGYRNTAMAEAFVQSLKEQGFTAHVYYKID